jgi:diguanylate cyclase (GGDEF)-like protein
MGADEIESVDERRFVEIDSALKRLNMTIAVVVAGAAVLFFGRFGAEFLAFASLPLLWWIGRRFLRLQRRIGLRRWNAALIITITVSVVGGAATSGGLGSPVVYFTGLIGLFAQATFPDVLFSKVGGLVAFAMIACIDLARHDAIEPFGFTAAAVIAGYLPLIVRELVQVEQIQRRSAVLDVLTGCLNRRSFEDHSAELDAQARLTGAAVAIISFDIDHFKAVNDQWGHAAGDRVLENVAYVARKQLRRFELMFRVGGEEFVVVLPDTGSVDALAIAEKLRNSIETTSADGISVTASFGVAVGSGGIEDVLARADEWLYIAKKSGRNRVIGPDPKELSESIETSSPPSGRRIRDIWPTGTVDT